MEVGKNTRFQKGNKATPVEVLRGTAKRRMLNYWFERKYKNQWRDMSSLSRSVAISLLSFKGGDVPEWAKS